MNLEVQVMKTDQEDSVHGTRMCVRVCLCTCAFSVCQNIVGHIVVGPENVSQQEGKKKEGPLRRN